MGTTSHLEKCTLDNFTCPIWEITDGRVTLASRGNFTVHSFLQRNANSRGGKPEKRYISDWEIYTDEFILLLKKRSYHKVYSLSSYNSNLPRVRMNLTCVCEKINAAVHIIIRNTRRVETELLHQEIIVTSKFPTSCIMNVFAVFKNCTKHCY